MPKELVTSVFVLGESAKAKTMEEKSRTGLKAQNVVQLPVPETKADNHLFWREGCNLGPAGWLAGSCALGNGCARELHHAGPGSRQQPCASTSLFICSPRSRPEITQRLLKKMYMFSLILSHSPLHQSPDPLKCLNMI